MLRGWASKPKATTSKFNEGFKANKNNPDE